jgi:acyl-CoA thioester hydrolase
MTVTVQPQTSIDIGYGYVKPTFVYFDDLDAMGMVHNARYAVLLERALTTFWDARGYTRKNGAPSHPDTFVAVAEYSISYKVPFFGTGEMLIHLWVERLGKTSVTYGFRALSDDRSTVHAEGRRTHIRVDPDTLRPTPWAADTCAIYESLQPV